MGGSLVSGGDRTPNLDKLCQCGALENAESGKCRGFHPGSHHADSSLKLIVLQFHNLGQDFVRKDFGVFQAVFSEKQVSAVGRRTKVNFFFIAGADGEGVQLFCGEDAGGPEDDHEGLTILLARLDVELPVELGDSAINDPKERSEAGRAFDDDILSALIERHRHPVIAKLFAFMGRDTVVEMGRNFLSKRVHRNGYYNI